MELHLSCTNPSIFALPNLGETGQVINYVKRSWFIPCVLIKIYFSKKVVVALQKIYYICPFKDKCSGQPCRYHQKLPWFCLGKNGKRFKCIDPKLATTVLADFLAPPGSVLATMRQGVTGAKTSVCTGKVFNWWFHGLWTTTTTPTPQSYQGPLLLTWFNFNPSMDK